MSYTKTTWQTGDTVTAEKLNNIEGGIENLSYGGFDAVIRGVWEDDTVTYSYLAGSYNSLKAVIESGMTPYVLIRTSADDEPALISISFAVNVDGLESNPPYFTLYTYAIFDISDNNVQADFLRLIFKSDGTIEMDDGGD